MILYHGSNVMIDKVDLSRSKPYKDFGRAFYLSDNPNQAFDMAKAKCIQFGGEPCITSFKVDESGMRVLEYLRFEEYSRDWARFVFNNRDETKQYSHSYDIVFGPIADDYIGLQMRQFRFQDITFEQFLGNIKYPKGITFQYAFCTLSAIKLLQRI